MTGSRRATRVSQRGWSLLSMAALLAACGGRSLIDDNASSPHSAGGSTGFARGGATSSAGSLAVGAAGGGSTGTADGGSGGRSLGLGGSGNAGAVGGTSAISGAAGTSTVKPFWRTTTESFCPPPGSVLNRNPIWSDARGVSVVTSTSESTSRVDSNDGAGWKLLTEDSKGPASPSLSGFPYGPLVEYGNSSCAVSFLENGVNHCNGAGSRVTALSIVDSQLAYAVHDDRVLRFSGSFFTPWGAALGSEGDPTTARGVWASKDSVVVVGDAGKIFFSEGMKWQKQAGAPQRDYRAVWGFSANDLWFGDDLGELVHFNGREFEIAAIVPTECGGPIRSLWGRDDTLFFATDYTFGTLRGGMIRGLGSFSCKGSRSILGMWGNSKTELFVATQDSKQIGATCSGIQLMWWDGITIHEL